MNKINQSLIPIAFAGAAIAYFTYYTNKSSQKTKDLQAACSLEKLIQILDEMKMEYTPYYFHYYHMLTALEKEYRGKPQL